MSRVVWKVYVDRECVGTFDEYIDALNTVRSMSREWTEGEGADDMRFVIQDDSHPARWIFDASETTQTVKIEKEAA